ncbi:hypothetical protein [Nitrospirillum bahiense]|uniref:Uncharacterized protein n=1 Tax=Nitrospirillum amazonense TaxID=28077 RepID=A0A560G1H0_9PROT|nr:hypothetical protein [Nitrospirillum amazonense]TWB27684.1 hypothetical protein FBZ88_106147 [Nitrospirillum amazonense]
MPVDQQDLAYSLASLNLSAVMCQGFEDDAYGAVLGLLHFRQLSLTARQAWVTAVSRAAAERSATTTFRSSASVFYSSLLQTRLVAFGGGLDGTSINDSRRLVMAPWCLTDAEFARCYVYVKDGAEPVLPEFDRSLMSDEQAEVANWTFSVGQYAATQFLKKYAPEIIGAVEVTLERLSLAILIGQGVKQLVDWALKEISKADLSRRYEIDSRRRNYLNIPKTGTGYVAAAGAR